MASRRELLDSLKPGMHLNKNFFLKVYGYEITRPGFAEDVIKRLEILGCSKAREYYTCIVTEFEYKHAFKRMQEEYERRKDAVASLEGREKVFWRKIEQIQKMDISRYCMKASDVFFLAELYNNNLFNASYSIFCFGFYQGMRYLKNQARKSK